MRSWRTIILCCGPHLGLFVFLALEFLINEGSRDGLTVSFHNFYVLVFPNFFGIFG